MSKIQIQNLSFSFPDGKQLFTSLTTRFPNGLTGLIGKNGTGKSTLFKLIAGELSPTSGIVSVNGSLRLFSQNESDFTSIFDAMGVSKYIEVLDQIVSGQSNPEVWSLLNDKWDIESQVRRLLAENGLEYLQLDTPYSVLSGGERMMIRFLGCLATQPDILLLDEPTNHLDTKFRHYVYSLLVNWKKTCVLISHDRELLNLVSSIAELRNGMITWYGGNYTFFKEIESKQREAISAEHDRAKRELKNLEEKSKIKFEPTPKSGFEKMFFIRYRDKK